MGLQLRTLDNSGLRHFTICKGVCFSLSKGWALEQKKHGRACGGLIVPGPERSGDETVSWYLGRRCGGSLVAS